MKIAIIGTHGSGKTTLVYKLASSLKENGYNVGIVEEVAAKCPFQINEGSSLESQLWIAYRQLIEELEKERKYEILITDRSIIDVYVYTISMSRRKNFKLPKWLELLIEEHTKTYDIIFKTKLNKKFLKEDGIRSTNPNWQKEIEDIFNDVLKEKKISYYQLPKRKQTKYMLKVIKNWKAKN